MKVSEAEHYLRIQLYRRLADDAVVNPINLANPSRSLWRDNNRASSTRRKSASPSVPVPVPPGVVAPTPILFLFRILFPQPILPPIDQITDQSSTTARSGTTHAAQSFACVPTTAYRFTVTRGSRTAAERTVAPERMVHCGAMETEEDIRVRITSFSSWPWRLGEDDRDNNDVGC